MITFTGRYKNGRCVTIHAKDLGFRVRKGWYSTRLDIGVKRYYSRVSAAACALSGRAMECRKNEDEAFLNGLGIDVDSLEIVVSRVRSPEQPAPDITDAPC
jgi:hypothetical protein